MLITYHFVFLTRDGKFVWLNWK